MLIPVFEIWDKQKTNKKTALIICKRCIFSLISLKVFWEHFAVHKDGNKRTQRAQVKRIK